jgi:hypothetical protein
MNQARINRVKAASLLFSTKGKYFSAGFYKKDGTYREIVSRTGVKKYRKTEDKKSFATNPDNPYFLVYDIKKKGYRVINLETLAWVKFGGTTYDVVEGTK